jgi:hypothetical protein
VSRPPRLSLAIQLPEPGRFWVRYAPKGWPGPVDRPWLDLAAGRLKGGEAKRPRPARAAHLARSPNPAALNPSSSGASSTSAPAGEMVGHSSGIGGLVGVDVSIPILHRSWSAVAPLGDVLYLPPVPRHLAAWRDRLAAEHLAAGTPLLVQLLPGDDLALSVTAGPPVAVALDLTAVLLGRDLDRLSTVAGWALAVWPLLPGLTDDPALWEKGCRKLATAGVRRVQALAPTLTPADRRRLATGAPEKVFDALFHSAGSPEGKTGREGWAPERDFARVAHRHGLEPFLPRPLARAPARGAGNRASAAALCLAAELWLRLGRPVEAAQALYRAARWVDATAYDVEALSREGNLGVVAALDERSRRLIREQGESGEPALLRELMAEYLATPAGGGGEPWRTSDAELTSQRP